jgi:hypothetical protein
MYLSRIADFNFDIGYFSLVNDIPPNLSFSISKTSTTRRIPIIKNTLSNGLVTYTSSDINVAKISGNYVVILRDAPVTITANQETAYPYVSESFSINLDSSYFTFITDICFPKGTPILTDQGLVPIEQLKDETIHGSRIVHVTKTVHKDSFLVCFEKDALGENLPSQRTVMTSKHRVDKDGVLVEAIHFVNDASVHKIPYNKELLYNVLLETHSMMNVNGLICETLNPSSKIAQFYMRS